MHQYMKSIGFGNIRDKKQLTQILKDVEDLIVITDSFDDCVYIELIIKSNNLFDSALNCFFSAIIYPPLALLLFKC